MFGVQATAVQFATAQFFYSDRDKVEFDQGHVTKNQPITMLILLGENLCT